MLSSPIARGFGMSAESAVQGSNGPTGDQNTVRVLALLTEALEIVDASNMRAEIGAKLHEAISALEESSGG